MSTLTDLFPTGQPEADASLRVLDVAEAESDEVFDALSSQTRRDVYRSLFENRKPVSDLAEGLDTSVQNVSHHISSLKEADLIEAVGQRYSEKGNEMAVYGPANDPLVFVGEKELRPSVDRILTDAVAGLGLLAGAALMVQWGVYQLLSPDSMGRTAIDPASYTSGSEGSQSVLVWLVFDAGEPGLVFFFLCLLIAGIAALGLRIWRPS